MSAKWAPGHSKTVLSRLKTHVFPLIGAPAIVELDTHDLMTPLKAIKKRGTIDVALRVQNYLQSIMREAKRLRLITQNRTSRRFGFLLGFIVFLLRKYTTNHCRFYK